MPFRFATALVAVEREGIIETHVLQLNGQDPHGEPLKEGAVRLGPQRLRERAGPAGRLREVPWYSFFTWGFKGAGRVVERLLVRGKEYQAPSALVDLSKPAFRLGLAENRVGKEAHQINVVKVAADKESYRCVGRPRSPSPPLPGGKPAANAEVAAMDQALLELMPNASWNLLEAMLQRRSWGVQTSTAQMEIIGRRHYGKKAVPAGGGRPCANTQAARHAAAVEPTVP